MSRLKDAILEKGKAYAGHGPVSNLAYGGQSGYMPAIGRIGPDQKNYAEWISNAPYIRQNIIPVVISYPRGFDYLPDSQMWIDTYNALMTLHPLTIDGLSSGLTVEHDETPIGSAGEMHEDFINVTRARTALSKTYKEKSGKAIQKFVDMVIRYLYSDPDVNKPLITNVSNLDFSNDIYTPDFYTGTNLYIEPDITRQRVVDAWLCTNVMFKGNGDRIGKSDIAGSREGLDLSLELTSITMANEAVMQLADTMLAQLNVFNVNPELGMVVPQAQVDAALAGSASGYNAGA